jgi:hypothetical protein
MLNDHQKNPQHSGLRDENAARDGDVQPIFWCGSRHSMQ